MSEEPFYSPKAKPRPPRQPKPSELLFECYRESNHTRWRCELRDHGEYGCEAQFYRNEEFFESRTFTAREGHPRTLAIAWAEAERKHIEAYVS